VIKGVKFRVDSGGGIGAGGFRVDIWEDTAKLKSRI